MLLCTRNDTPSRVLVRPESLLTNEKGKAVFTVNVISYLTGGAFITFTADRSSAVVENQLHLTVDGERACPARDDRLAIRRLVFAFGPLQVNQVSSCGCVPLPAHRAISVSPHDVQR